MRTRRETAPARRPRGAGRPGFFALPLLVVAALLAPLARAAGDPCRPKQMDVCGYAKQSADGFQYLLTGLDKQFEDPKRDLAYRSMTADGGTIRAVIVTRQTEAEVRASKPDPAWGWMYSIVGLHYVSRKSFCGAGPAQQAHAAFLANGGRFSDTYYSRDGKKITEAMISSCDVGATTWAGTDTDPCKPMGFDACAWATKMAAMTMKSIRPVDEQLAKDRFAMERMAAEGATLRVDGVFALTRAEYERTKPAGTTLEGFVAGVRDHALKTSCMPPMATFVTYGGSLRQAYRYRDGEPLADVVVSQCLALDDPPASNTPGTH